MNGSDDDRHGKGVSFHKNGDKEFEGVWEDGQFQTGIFHAEDGTVKTFEDGNEVDPAGKRQREEMIQMLESLSRPPPGCPLCTDEMLEGDEVYAGTASADASNERWRRRGSSSAASA